MAGMIGALRARLSESRTSRSLQETMSQADAVTRVSQIEAQLAQIQGAFTPHAAQAVAGTSAPAGATTATTQAGATTFANTLSQAQASTPSPAGTGGAPLSGKALGMLTGGP